MASEGVQNKFLLASDIRMEVMGTDYETVSILLPLKFLKLFPSYSGQMNSDNF